MSILHHGPWDAHSRQSGILRFIEAYNSRIDTLSLSSVPSTTFYAPLAIFHDHKGDAHLGGAAIWSRIQRLFSPFSRTFHEVVEIRIVPGEEGRVVVYAEFLTHFWFKGERGLEEDSSLRPREDPRKALPGEADVVAPRFFVWTIGEAVDDGGTEGLQIVEARCFWDTGILGRYVTERNRRRMREREQVSCEIGKEVLMIQ